MKHFQIRFVDSKGSGHFKYFGVSKDSDQGYIQEALDIINKNHEEKLQRACAGLFSHYEPLKTITVVEYNKETKRPVRKGIKFKLKLSFAEYTFLEGGLKGTKVRNTFYILKD